MVLYAFTLTLLPKMYKRTVKYQYRQSCLQFNRLFEKDDQRWRIVEAYPELTYAMNLHIHGIVKYLGPNAAFARLDFIQKLRDHQFFGTRVDINQMQNEVAWTEYIKKDQDSEVIKHLTKGCLLRYRSAEDYAAIEDAEAKHARLINELIQEEGRRQKERLLYNSKLIDNEYLSE